MKGLFSAIRLLTIVPIPGGDAGLSGASLPWFPVVGAMLGGIVYAILAMAGPYWPAGAAILSVTAMAILTRGLHLDGIADAADGLGGGRDRESALAIMKDSRTGAFGVIALCLILMAKTLAFWRLADSVLIAWVIPAGAISRFMQLDMMVRLPNARPGGLAAAIMPEARWRHWAIGLLLSVAIVLPIGGPAGIIGLIGALCANVALGAWFKRRVGGVTGDLIGATSEISETSILLFAAFMVTPAGTP